jgi:hypothetical protein
MKLEFFRRIFEIQISNLMKIRPVGAEFHAIGQADGQPDITKGIVSFCSFANTPIIQ